MTDTVDVIIDRPIGYVDKYHNVYPINYGYVPGIIAGDGEEQDVYVLDSNITTPITTYHGKVIAIVIRHDDNETKWIVSNESFTKEQIIEKIYFMEQYFDFEITMIS